MHFTCFYQWHELPETANNLFLQAEQESLFFSRNWFENLANTALKSNQSLLLACVIDNDESQVLAILPLIKSDDNQWTSLSHIYTSLKEVH